MRNAKPIPPVLGYETKTLWDPIQTNAVYGVPEWDVDRVKTYLKTEHKATRFRIVKPHFAPQNRIICFKIPQ